MLVKTGWLISSRYYIINTKGHSLITALISDITLKLMKQKFIMFYTQLINDILAVHN